MPLSAREQRVATLVVEDRLDAREMHGDVRAPRSDAVARSDGQRGRRSTLSDAVTRGSPRRRDRLAAIRITTRFPASPQRVFAAWLDRETAGAWLFATASRPMTRVDIDARVGGSFRFREARDGALAEHTGHYLEMAAHHRLAFTLRTSMLPGVTTRVRVEISPRNAGCALTLTHEEVPPGCLRSTRARWTGILYGLGVTLDTTP